MPLYATVKIAFGAAMSLLAPASVRSACGTQGRHAWSQVWLRNVFFTMRIWLTWYSPAGTYVAACAVFAITVHITTSVATCAACAAAACAATCAAAAYAAVCAAAHAVCTMAACTAARVTCAAAAYAVCAAAACTAACAACAAAACIAAACAACVAYAATAHTYICATAACAAAHAACAACIAAVYACNFMVLGTSGLCKTKARAIPSQLCKPCALRSGHLFSPPAALCSGGQKRSNPLPVSLANVSQHWLQLVEPQGSHHETS